MPKFIHADNCTLYAEDAQETDEPWLRWQFLVGGVVWSDANAPLAFNPNKQYRRKPRTVRIGTFDVPAPVREPLGYGALYWLADITNDAPVSYKWHNDGTDLRYLAAGLIHLTKEAAQIHIDALLSFTKRGE